MDKHSHVSFQNPNFVGLICTKQSIKKKIKKKNKKKHFTIKQLRGISNGSRH